MNAIQMKPDVYWVGGIDWDIRNFHGYLTQRGTTYNAYLKGLKPKKRKGLAFGSYGWGGQAAPEIEKIMTELSWEIPISCVKVNYISEDEELQQVKGVAKHLVKHIE